jgi:hypothetical protein
MKANTKYGVDIFKLGNGTVTYERKRFLGENKVIARYILNDQVEDASIVSVKNMNDPELVAYSNLLGNLGRKDIRNSRREIAEEIRSLNKKMWNIKEMAEIMGKTDAYISQIVMIYQIEITALRSRKKFDKSIPVYYNVEAVKQMPSNLKLPKRMQVAKEALYSDPCVVNVSIKEIKD